MFFSIVVFLRSHFLLSPDKLFCVKMSPLTSNKQNINVSTMMFYLSFCTAVVFSLFAAKFRIDKMQTFLSVINMLIAFSAKPQQKMLTFDFA